ncbi:MAG: mechanosensitive ion channel family protein [Maribacter sp.]|nr:mechanosensitive ion channel family protein [Maribacter sp.]
MQALLDILKEPIVLKILKTLLWVLGVVILIIFLRKMAKKRITNLNYRYNIQKTIEMVGYFLIVMIILLSFTFSNLKDYTVIIGLFTAGIAFTLQELILSVAGSFYIFVLRLYKPGDRIELNNIRGDVIDINTMYTTIMEIGEWVSTDNYSGRIVKISNSFVFKGPIKNYSMDFHFLWDEIVVMITYGSDLELAQKIILKDALGLISEYTEKSKKEWKGMVDRYYIENATLDPTIAIKLTSNWIELNLRYVTDYRLRRTMKHQLFEKIEKSIAATNGKVSIASTTIQLIKIPEVEVRMKS